MVRIGQISYSLYLWHWPLVAYGDYLFLLESTEVRWLVVLLSCWLGYLSWRWIETPFRDKHLLASRKAIFGLFAAYALICIALGGAYRLVDGKVFSTEREVLKPTRSRIFAANMDDPNLVLPSLGARDVPASFLLWGDSHAMSSLAPVLDALGAEMKVRGLQLTDNSKAPLVQWGYVPSAKKNPIPETFKTKWANLALETVESQRLQVVFLVGFWEIYSRSSFPKELQDTVQEFNRRGAKVVFVGDNPALLREPTRQYRLAGRWSWISPPTPASSEEHHAKNAIVYEAIKVVPKQSNFEVIDLAPVILGWDDLVSEDGQLLYYDDDHLSDAGSVAMSPLLEPIIKELAE